MPPRKLTRNAAECLKCGDTIESRGLHDTQFCTCGAVAIAGGLDVKRHAWTEPHEYRDRSEWIDA